ncbi:MAG: GntR family transcriptional regulator [Clostridia bacterium]|nr:GntR family transcriptional regulator [Clostridia bacterium]
MGWMFESNLPIYLQIAKRLEREIVSGKIERGQPIKSVRDLASEAAVNPNTVQRAMQELENRHLVTVQRGGGRFVTEDEETIKAAGKRLAEEGIHTFAATMKHLGFSKEETLQLIEEEWNYGV